MYDLTYSQRRRTVALLTGQDEKGKTFFVRNAPIILNVNSDRLTTITLLDSEGGKKVTRFRRGDVLVQDQVGTLVANLISGNRLSFLEGTGHK